MTWHYESAKPSEFKAFYEFYLPSDAGSLADSAVADQRCECRCPLPQNDTLTSDSDQLREEVQRYLTHVNIRVLPERFFSRSPSACTEALEKDLTETDLFVQIFRPLSGYQDRR